MSFLTKYYIGGEEIRPVNADSIGFKLDWTGDAREAELTTETIVLSNRAKQLVINHIDTLGIFEGVPLTVEIGNITIDYFIELTDNPIISGEGDSEIEVSIKRRKAADYFLTQARGLSFEALNKTHPIQTIQAPYLIIRDNQMESLIMLSISAYTLTKALIEGVRDVVNASSELLSATTPNEIVGALLRLAARVVYVAALLLALIDVCKQIIELIFPPVRYLKASTVKELLTKGCSKLGYNFSSTLIDSMPGLTILPVPLKKETNSIFTNLFTLNNGSYTKGYPTALDTTPTLERLLNEVSKMFNAKIRIVGNTVHFERRDFWILNSGLTIKSMLNIQAKRENQWRYNLGETWKRYYIHYRTDPSDIHTLDKIDKTDAEYSTEPVTVVNADLVSIKGLADVSLNFAFGIRKDSLNFIEKIALEFAKLADKVIGFFGGSSNLAALVNGRVGVTQISQQYYTVSKLIYQINGRQPTNYLDIIGAPRLWKDFHYINKVKENFKRIYNSPIPFSTNNFETLLNNNYVTDVNGLSLEILTFEWINESKTAEIDYSEFSNEAHNTKTIVIDE